MEQEKETKNFSQLADGRLAQVPIEQVFAQVEVTSIEKNSQKMASISRFLLNKADDGEQGKGATLNFNMTSDPLKLFLDNLTSVVAAQTKKISKLEQQLSLRSEDIELSNAIKLTVDKIEIGEPKDFKAPVGFTNTLKMKGQNEFKKVDCAHTDEPFDRFPSSKGYTELSFITNKLGDKLCLLSESILKSKEDFTYLSDEINDLKVRMDKTADDADLRDKIRRNKNQIKTQFQTLHEETKNQMGSTRKLVTQRLQTLSDQFKKNQQNTLWKITDCLELLRDRVSQEHVRESLKNLDERLSSELDDKIKLNEEKNESIMAEFRKRLRQINQSSSHKISDLKENQQKMTVQIDTKADNLIFHQTKKQFERFKESANRQFDDISNAFKRHDREFVQIHKLLNGLRYNLDQTVRQLNTMMTNQTALLQQIQAQMAEYSKLGGEMSKQLQKKLSKSGGQFPAPTIPAPIAAPIAAPMAPPAPLIPPQQFLDMKNSLTTLQSKLDGMNRDLDKIQKTVNSHEDQVTSLQNTMPKKAEKQELKAALQSRAIFDQMNKQLQREFTKLKDQLDNTLRHFEQKFIKMRPDAQLKAIQKSLKQKANGDEVGKQMLNHDLRIKNHQNVLTQINDELQAFAQALRSTQDYIENIETNSAQVLAGTKGINCLSCGRNQWGQLILGGAGAAAGQSSAQPTSQGAQRMGANSPMEQVTRRKSTMKKLGQKSGTSTEYDNSGGFANNKNLLDMSSGGLAKKGGDARQSYDPGSISSRHQQGIGGNRSQSPGTGVNTFKKKVKLPLSYQVQNEVKQGLVKP